MSRSVSLGLIYDAVLSRQAVLVWYPLVTPQLSPVCRGQSTWPAAECLFTGEAGQWHAVWTGSEPVPTPDHSSSLTSNTVLFFSLSLFSASPKGQINNESFLLHTHTHTHSGPDSAGLLTGFSYSTKWQNSRSAEEKTAARAHEFMENGTLSTI